MLCFFLIHSVCLLNGVVRPLHLRPFFMSLLKFAVLLFVFLFISSSSLPQFLFSCLPASYLNIFLGFLFDLFMVFLSISLIVLWFLL